MEHIPFNQWWLEFLHEHRHDKDGGYHAVDDLVKWICHRAPLVQTAFRNELVTLAVNQANGWGVALAALEQLASNDDCRVLSSQTVDRLFEGREEWVAAVLQVLVRDCEGPGYEAVREFLLIRSIGPFWSGVAWGCWPTDPTLFAEAWTRYFRSTPLMDWKGKATAQAFLSDPDALAVLKTRLQAEHPGAWAALRSDLQMQRNAPWLGSAQREALEAVLEF